MGTLIWETPRFRAARSNGDPQGPPSIRSSPTTPRSRATKPPSAPYGGTPGMVSWGQVALLYYEDAAGGGRRRGREAGARTDAEGVVEHERVGGVAAREPGATGEIGGIAPQQATDRGRSALRIVNLFQGIKTGGRVWLVQWPLKDSRRPRRGSCRNGGASCCRFCSGASARYGRMNWIFRLGADRMLICLRAVYPQQRQAKMARRPCIMQQSGGEPIFFAYCWQSRARSCRLIRTPWGLPTNQRDDYGWTPWKLLSFRRIRM